MTGLSGLNELVERYLSVEQNIDFSERRRDILKSRIVVEISDTMSGSWRKMVSKKHMQTTDEDIQQHVRIAIVRAIERWKPEIASFSTFAHYQIMWELGNYEHYAYPERRRIKLKNPLQFIELDRLHLDPDTGNMISKLDILVDEFAHKDIENHADRNKVLEYIECVLSVHIERRILTMSTDADGRYISERQIYTLCRDIDIFIQTQIIGHTHAILAEFYAVTRERVRQIVGNVESKLSTYLPTRNDDNFDPPQELYKGKRHPLWDALIGWYFHYADRDMRCIQDKPMMAYEKALKYFTPVTPLKSRTVTVIETQETVAKTKRKGLKSYKIEGFLPINLPESQSRLSFQKNVEQPFNMQEECDVRQIVMPFIQDLTIR